MSFSRFFGLHSRFISSFLLLLGVQACSAESEKSAYVLDDFADVERLISTAQSGGDPKISTSNPDRSGKSMVLLRLDGKPALSYVTGIAGSNGRQTEFSVSCGRDGNLDITEVLFDPNTKAGGLATDGGYELELSPYGANTKYRLPVKIIKQFTDDSRLFVRVQGSAKATDPFFANLRPTTNFSAVLKQGGRYLSPYHGVDLSGFETHLKPLIDYCGGTNPTSPATADNATPRSAKTDANDGVARNTSNEVSLYRGPTANQIRDALKRQIEARLARLDAMADQCKTFKQQNNPIGAAMCLMTGGGAMTSKSIRLSVKGVSLDRCVISDDRLAYCRYRADASMHGSGMMGQVANSFNTLLALGQWTYSSFTISNGQWEWVKTYDSCDFGGKKIHCRWTETR